MRKKLKDFRLYYYTGGILKKFGTSKTGNFRHYFNSKEDVNEYLTKLENKTPLIYKLASKYQLFLVEYSGPHKSEVIHVIKVSKAVVTFIDITV